MSDGIIKHDRIRVAAAGTPQPKAAGARSCAKSVRLIEREGRAIAVELRCSCGELTVLELDYPQTPPAPASPPKE